MKNFEHIKLTARSTIKEALEIIDTGAIKIAVVLGEGDKLLGTVSDGDVRRGLLNGLGLESIIEPIFNQNPITFNINDSKEDILKEAIEKKIYQIPIIDKNGVLVGIDVVDELIKPAEFPNKVILMVGGLGSRLGALTNDRPKPLLEVGNKPILETIIQSFAKYGFKNIVLSVNYKSQMIEKFFGNGADFDVNIEYIHEEKRLGTAGALCYLRGKLKEPFFVMNGDLLTNVNFEHMLEYHLFHQAAATMGVREYDFQVPYGVVNLDDHNVISIDEKPVHKFFVSGGVYVLDTDVLEYVPDDTFYDMPTLFEQLIEKNKKTISFPIREYWLDIGRVNDFKQANDEYHGVFS